MLISVVQTQIHTKRHETPLKYDIVSLTSSLSTSPAIVHYASILKIF